MNGLRSRAFGIPGTIGIEITKRYTVWCAVCNDSAMDTCPSKEYFEQIIKRMGWRKSGDKWACSYDCAAALREGAG